MFWVIKLITYNDQIWNEVEIKMISLKRKQRALIRFGKKKAKLPIISKQHKGKEKFGPIYMYMNWSVIIIGWNNLKSLSVIFEFILFRHIPNHIYR